jgi:L-asparaginase II
MSKPRMTRRAMVALTALPLTGSAAADDFPAAIRELALPAELRAELDQRVQRAIEEARWLADLPLDDVAPGFVFHPE